MKTNSKKGFTIIEVVLVLAIAGLIFLMVFIALPNMQRSQRDTQRRNDYSALSANMTQYMTNNNGALPASFASGSAAKFINASGNDPDGIPYNLNAKKCNSATDCTVDLPAVDRDSTGSTVYVVTNASCKDGALEYKKSTRAFAIYGNLETGTGTYCQSNS